MIWITDHKGLLAYICEDWHRLTGQRPDAALGAGWLDAVHPEDRGLVAKSFAEACRHRAEFMLRYRLRRGDGSYVWVIDAATPSFTPLSHEFIGYLGLVSCYDESTQDLKAKAEIGSFKPGRALAEFKPVSKLDLVADHLIMAKAAAVGCPPGVTKAIDDALHAAARALVEGARSGEALESVH